jgi:hypothetical protein
MRIEATPMTSEILQIYLGAFNINLIISHPFMQDPEIPIEEMSGSRNCGCHRAAVSETSEASDVAVEAELMERELSDGWNMTIFENGKVICKWISISSI